MSQADFDDGEEHFEVVSWFSQHNLSCKKKKIFPYSKALKILAVLFSSSNISTHNSKANKPTVDWKCGFWNSETLANSWGLPKDKITSCQSKNPLDSVNSPWFWEIGKCRSKMKLCCIWKGSWDHEVLVPRDPPLLLWGPSGSFSSRVHSSSLYLFFSGHSSPNTIHWWWHNNQSGKLIKSYFFLRAQTRRAFSQQ